MLFAAQVNWIWTIPKTSKNWHPSMEIFFSSDWWPFFVPRVIIGRQLQTASVTIPFRMARNARSRTQNHTCQVLELCPNHLVNCKLGFEKAGGETMPYTNWPTWELAKPIASCNSWLNLYRRIFDGRDLTANQVSFVCLLSACFAKPSVWTLFWGSQWPLGTQCWVIGCLAKRANFHPRGL